MAEVIYLSNVRLSFPKLIEASAMADFPNSEKKYGCDFIMRPDHESYKRFMTEVGKVAVEKWKEHAGTVLQLIQNDRLKRCYGSGAEKIDKKTMRVLDGYGDGMMFISANSKEDRPPQMIRPDGTVVDNSNTAERAALARKLYGGCYVNAAVRPWCQDNQFGRGVRNELIAVQFHTDGDPFGEAPPDLSHVFGAVASAPAAGAVPGFAPGAKMPWEA